MGSLSEESGTQLLTYLWGCQQQPRTHGGAYHDTTPSRHEKQRKKKRKRKTSRGGGKEGLRIEHPSIRALSPHREGGTRPPWRAESTGAGGSECPHRHCWTRCNTPPKRRPRLLNHEESPWIRWSNCWDPDRGGGVPVAWADSPIFRRVMWPISSWGHAKRIQAIPSRSCRGWA